MSDTIELLETIGQNAALRHAPVEELACMLDQVKASEALKSAVATGDSSRLSQGFGSMPNQVPQISNAPGHEEGEPDQDDDDKPPYPSDLAHSAANQQPPHQP